MLCYVVSCVVVCCGVVCDTLKNPCVHPTRPRVYVQNVPCVLASRANVFQHVRVVPAYTGACGVDTREEGRRREGSSSASFFIGKTSVFDILELTKILPA